MAEEVQEAEAEQGGCEQGQAGEALGRDLDPASAANRHAPRLRFDGAGEVAVREGVGDLAVRQVNDEIPQVGHGDNASTPRRDA